MKLLTVVFTLNQFYFQKVQMELCFIVMTLKEIYF